MQSWVYCGWDHGSDQSHRFVGNFKKKKKTRTLSLLNSSARPFRTAVWGPDLPKSCWTVSATGSPPCLFHVLISVLLISGHSACYLHIIAYSQTLSMPRVFLWDLMFEGIVALLTIISWFMYFVRLLFNGNSLWTYGCVWLIIKELRNIERGWAVLVSFTGWISFQICC